MKVSHIGACTICKLVKRLNYAETCFICFCSLARAVVPNAHELVISEDIWLGNKGDMEASRAQHLTDDENHVLERYREIKERQISGSLTVHYNKGKPKKISINSVSSLDK